LRRESWGDFRYKNTTHKTTTDPRLGAATSQGTELAVMGERRACNGIRGGRRLEDPPALPLDRRRRPAGAATALRVSRRLVAPTASLRDAAGSMCQMGVGYHVGNPSAQRTANPIPLPASHKFRRIFRPPPLHRDSSSGGRHRESPGGGARPRRYGGGPPCGSGPVRSSRTPHSRPPASRGTARTSPGGRGAGGIRVCVGLVQGEIQNEYWGGGIDPSNLRKFERKNTNQI